MIRKPTLYLLCGLPGSGKTTLAKRLEQENSALRFTPDEWMVPLYGDGICEPNTLDQWNLAHDRVEKVQWQLAEKALLLGVNVVLDFGVWAREERDDFRARTAALGARSELLYLEESLDVLKERVKARNENAGKGTYLISEAELEEWSTQFESPTPDELKPRE
ncbi:MAG TPA: AAA family ATPase [Fimbriimonadaceae bacterium]